MTRRHAEIAGGGIAGLALSMMLARRGWTVRVHERAPAIREIGAGIYIKNNSIEVLEEFEVFDALARRAIRIDASQIRDGEGTVLLTRPLTTDATRVYVLPRQALVEELRDGALAAGVEIRTGSDVAGARADGTLLLASGETLRADLVVGCDGFSSVVRGSVGIRARSRLLGTYINRYLLPHRRYTPEAVSTENSVGRRRLGVSPCGPDETYVFTVSPVDEQRAWSLPLDVPTWRDTHPRLQDLLEELAASPATSYQYGLVKVDRWQVGRVALVGDAATGMPPTLGQGAGLTIMNGRALVEALDRVADVRDALPQWERAARVVSELTQDWAIRWDWITRGCPDWLTWLRAPTLAVVGAVPAINRRIRIADQGLGLIMSRIG